MPTKWETFDNAISDLWDFFVPPIINAIVILIVFPNIPIKIWKFVASIVEQLRTVTTTFTDKGIDLQLLEPLKMFFDKYASYLSTTDFVKFISSSTLTAVIIVSILIYILHRVVLVSSSIIFGNINLIENRLLHHPQVGILLNKMTSFLPDDNMYCEVSNCWEYAKSINDTHEGLVLYRARRSNITSMIENNRGYSKYATAYFLMSLLSIIKIKFSWMPIIVLLSTIGGFIYFSQKYFYYCIQLISYDIKTFLSIAHLNHGSKSSSINLRKSKIDTSIEQSKSYLIYINLFEGNIVKSIIEILKSIYGILDYMNSKYFKHKLIDKKPLVKTDL